MHGDLKRQNVLVAPDGHVTLVDFGLARTLDPATAESLTRPGAGGDITGTLPFMAPETIRGAPLLPGADVWALGVLLHEMAAGSRPFTGENAYDLAAAIIGRPRSHFHPRCPRPWPPSSPAASRKIRRVATRPRVRRSSRSNRSSRAHATPARPRSNRPPPQSHRPRPRRRALVREYRADGRLQSSIRSSVFSPVVGPGSHRRNGHCSIP